MALLKDALIERRKLLCGMGTLPLLKRSQRHAVLAICEQF
jgi:hypothetical protein